MAGVDRARSMRFERYLDLLRVAYNHSKNDLLESLYPFEYSDLEDLECFLSETAADIREELARRNGETDE